MTYVGGIIFLFVGITMLFIWRDVIRRQDEKDKEWENLEKPDKNEFDDYIDMIDRDNIKEDKENE